MADLFDHWITQKAKVVEPQTSTGFKITWKSHCASPIGEVLIREITTGKIDALISSVAERTVSGARISRIVLSGMLQIAVRFDFLLHNTVRAVPRPTVKRTGVRALTLDELEELGSRIRTYCRHRNVDGDGVVNPKLGPRPGADLENILMVMLATGARIGESLALTWPQLDLDSAIARVTIDATLIVPRVAGERLFARSIAKATHRPSRWCFRRSRPMGFAAAWNNLRTTTPPMRSS